MPIGLTLTVVSAIVGWAIFNNRLEHGKDPKAHIILAAVILCAIVGRELDYGFWSAVGLPY